MTSHALLVTGPEIAAYGFPDGHPFGRDRHEVFRRALEQSPAFADVEVVAPRTASRAELEMFHTPAYIDRVIAMSREGVGWLDQGDTPAFPGVFEAACAVVGGTLSDVFNPELGHEALRYALAASVLLYLVAAGCLLAAVGRYRRKLRASAVPPAAAAAASA